VIPVSRPRGRFEGPKRLIRATLPLRARKGLARLLGRQKWFSGRYWWIQELLRDFADADANAYHRFLWAHHLGYAETYEVEIRFGAGGIHPTRRLLFEDLTSCLRDLDVAPDAVASVFEVGCSLGYNLRFLETEVFRSGQTFEGCDIDAYAVQRGQAHLRHIGSRVRLNVTDMSSLDRRLGNRMYHVILCAGVLMYLRRDAAEKVVASVLRHTRGVVAFAGLAAPDRDNALLRDSEVRASDGTFVHNIDEMVTRCGGRVAHRRWEGARQIEGNSVYFVFATPRPAC
jgi:SAM-dependent methyltransferase